MIEGKVVRKTIQFLSKEFAIQIIRYALLLKDMKVEYPLRDQLLRSGTSIGANIVEASASSSRREFTRFYEIALRSSNETDYWIDLIELVYGTNESSIVLKRELSSIRKILGSIIVKLKANSPQA